MTRWRDARLQRALDDAPDAQALPQPAVRRAVQDAARAAIAPAPRIAWWKRRWIAPGSGMQWNAALASVLVASLVTVLWHGREIPQAAPEKKEIAQVRPPLPAPAAAPASASPPPPPASPPADVVAQMHAARPGAAPPTRPKPPPAASTRAEVTADQRSRTGQDVARDTSAPQAERQTGPAEQQTGPRALAKQAPDSLGSTSLGERAVPSAPVAAAPAAAPQLQARAQEPAAAAWTDIRIASATRTVDLPREQAGRLAHLVDQVLAHPRSPEPLHEPVSNRLELRREGVLMGVLELAGEQLRWIPAGQSTGAIWRAPSEQLHALREEMARLLAR